MQRHVRVHRCLALLRGVIDTYPGRRPALAIDGAPDAAVVPIMPTPDNLMCTADVLAMLEEPSLSQVASVMLHLQVLA